MKKIHVYLLVIAICFDNTSCKKGEFPSRSPASVNIVNASIDDQPIFVYFTFADSNYYLQNNPVYTGSNRVYTVVPGNNPLTIVSAGDTSKPLYQTSLSAEKGAIYTLYLAGVGKNLDTVLTRDKIPMHTDSVAGVRFINLSPGSQAMTVNLEGNAPEQTEVAALEYLQISDFKTYPVNDNYSYNFEIRDKATGNLLTIFTWNFSLYKNYTLVIGGSEDPGQIIPVNVFPVNNF